MIISKGSKALFIIILISLVTGYFLYPRIANSLRPSDNVAFSSIAVLPFVNMSNDPNQNYFSDGLTDDILNSITRLEGLKVSARNSSFQFRGKDVDIKEVGKKLVVETVLEGSVQLDGDRVRITAQLINVEDGFHFWSEQYDEKLDDVFAIHDKIASAIAEKLAVTMVNTSHKKVYHPVRKEAYKLYLKGLSHWNARTPSDLKKGIELFEQAIAIDSTYAAAYSGLADCYNVLGYLSHTAPHLTFPKGKEAALKALQLDSSLSGSHATLGFYNFYYGWDWEAAEQEFRTAIALNPNYALAYDWYGYYLTAMERYDEALVILQKAIELDPLSDPIHTDVGFSTYYSGNYEKAIEKLKTCVETNSRYPLTHLWLGRSYQEQGKYSLAIHEYKTTLSINPDWPVALAALGHVYGVSGKRDSAQYVLNKLNDISTKKFVTAYGMALVYTGLGDKNRAFEWLKKAYEERSNWLVWLKTDPRFNSLRSERQFSEMVNTVGLPR